MIYLTGATGFIGSRVARTLLERGERIRCLVRSRARAAALAAAGAELVMGDVADEAVHAQALGGVSGALHLAASYEIGIVDGRALQRTNVEGTRAFLAAAERARTPKLVYVSTTAALGPSADPANEPREAYTGPYHSAYHQTKAEAHRLARAAQLSGAPLVIVCPAFVYGPGDEGPAGDFIRDLGGRKLPALLTPPSWFSYVFVDDAAAGIVAALDRGRPGEVYLLTGEVLSMNEFALRVTALAGVKPPALRLPAAVGRALGTALDPIARATGLKFPITLEGARIAARDRWLHGRERAERELGYAPRALASGLPETIAATLGAAER